MGVGFSASNGQGSSIHIVDRWRFKTFRSLPPGILTDTFEEGDCFMCSSPEDSSTKSSPENRCHERKTKTVEMALGLGGLATYVVSILTFVFVICFVCVKKRRVASAKVCKGSLPSEGEVAVKRFERADGIGSLRNPFTTEFATMVGCLRQKNLIQLHGWCCEGNALVLVYEYIAQRKSQQSSPQKLQFSSCPILEAKT
ncbi:hypothetical protein FF1_002509 [Malus domestica]